MCQFKTSIIPILVGTLVLVKKGTAKHFEKIPGKQNLAEVQEIVFTCTAHILRKQNLATTKLGKKRVKFFMIF